MKTEGHRVLVDGTEQVWRDDSSCWVTVANEPLPGDRKWVDGSEYKWDGSEWYATGVHTPGITNTPRAGEREGSRDRKPEDAFDLPVSDAMAELRAVAARLETDSAKRKDVPIYSGFVRYFPDAMAEVARLSKAGNDKHNPGEPLHWSRGKSDDHLDCLMRHLAEVGNLDDDGFYHDVKVAWRALTHLQSFLERVRGLPISPGSKP
jgi:hypothetical protein